LILSGCNQDIECPSPNFCEYNGSEIYCYYNTSLSSECAEKIMKDDSSYCEEMFKIKNCSEENPCICWQMGSLDNVDIIDYLEGKLN